MNADYRPAKHPNEPAFDWLTFDDLQPTMDQVLQESVAYYDPFVHVIVFVFLPSKSGNSMAIWRRKIAVPNNVRLAYQAQIQQALAALRKNYVVHVDEYVYLVFVITGIFNTSCAPGYRVVDHHLLWWRADSERKRSRRVGGRKCSLSSGDRTCILISCWMELMNTVLVAPLVSCLYPPLLFYAPLQVCDRL